MNDKKLEAMRYAGFVNLRAIEEGSRLLQRGVALKHVNDKVEQAILSGGCEPAFKGYRGFPAAACISVNDVAVHGIPGEYELQDADTVTIDVGTRYNGFCVDAARTFVIDCPGLDPVTRKRWYSRVQLAESAEAILQAELDVIKDGVTLYDIADAGDKEAQHQCVSLMVQWGGHKIGDVIHIDPFIPNGFDWSKGEFGVKLEKRRLRQHVLHAGETICLEPVVTYGSTEIIIDEDGWTVRAMDGSDVAHTERCLLITEDGYELLS